MKKLFLLFAIAAVGLWACKKGDTVNVYTGSMPAFIVTGITDVNLQNSGTIEAFLELSVQYEDSTQQQVTLSLSALPAGIALDSTWQKSGYPTFSTSLVFYDTTSAGATPGTYPMTLTATTASGAKKTYTFNIKVKAQTPCTTFFLGKYTNCQDLCVSSSNYTDSIYNDPTVVNKVWFSNFANSGHAVYGIYNCNSEVLTIPSQVVNGVTYSGSGDVFSVHSFNMDIFINGSGCEATMN
jgi:hypothetical protein